MSGRVALLTVATLLAASLAGNAWLLLGRAPGSSSAPSAAEAALEPTSAPAGSPLESPAASFAAMVGAVEAARRAAALAPPPSALATPRAPVDGFGEGRVTRALLDELQCELARQKAAEAWRKEAEGIRAALLRSEPASAEQRAANLAGTRAELADVLGVDEGDARLAPLAEALDGLREEASAEVRRLMASEPPEWRAALDVVRGLYRQEDAAVLRAFNGAAADDWRMNEVEERAAILAIGASLVGVPWASIDDRTPPALSR